MKINYYTYPYNLETRKLPIHLTGIGGSEWQEHVVREQGYESHQILYSASESGFLKFDGAEYPIGPGMLFFLPAEYPHEYYPVGEKWDVRWVTFSGYSASHILSLLSMTKPIIIKPGDPGDFESLFSRMLTALSSDKRHGSYTCSGLIYEYLLEFHRYAAGSAGEPNGLITGVIDYINDNYGKDFPLTELAEVAGVTPQHLCRVFKEAMNMRPHEYLTKKRIQEAKILLSETELAVSEVSSSCGFVNAGHFSTVFKRLEGISPVEYRFRRKNRSVPQKTPSDDGKNDPENKKA